MLLYLAIQRAGHLLTSPDFIHTRIAYEDRGKKRHATHTALHLSSAVACRFQL